MTKQIKKTISFLSIIALVFTLNGCGGGGGGNGGATATSSVEKSDTYTFENTTNSLTIESYRPYEISFQLTKDGLAQANQAISMETFDVKYGTITDYNIVTDENGVGIFTYNPPTIDPKSNKTISYSYQTDNNVTENIVKTIELIFDKYVLSDNDKTTTLSLVYMKTIAEEGSGKIINRYRVHAVDKKSNQPRVGIPVSMSLISNKKLVHLDGTGSIENNNSTIVFRDSTITVKDKSNNFTNLSIKDEDNLIILPTKERLDASYLGGWTIKTVSDNNLTFKESDVNLTENNLSYVIGNEVRLVGGQIAVADVVNVNNDTTTDENGYIIFDVTFDPKLAGHTVTLEAHGDIDGKRVGVSQIAILRFDDINAKSYVIDNQDDDNNKTITLTALINSTETLSKIKLDKNSFHAVSSGSNVCSIKESSFTNDSNNSVETTEDGEIILTVETTQAKEDNKSVVTTCTVSWDGGMTSINREY